MEGRETNLHRLEKRQQQINIGKNTRQYRAYKRARRENPRGTPKIPVPRITDKRSTRSFRGMVSEWRRRLHTWYNAYGMDYDDEYVFIPDQTWAQCVLCGKQARFMERRPRGRKFCSDKCLKAMY